MNLKHTLIAVIKAVLLISVIIPAYSLAELGFPGSVPELKSWLLFFSLSYGVYLVLSFAGWVCIGWPVHWIILQYGNGHWMGYLGASIAFTLVVYISSNLEGAVLLGFSANLQGLLFRYIVYNSPQPA